MGSFFYIFGAVMLIGGIAINIWVNRRRFSRRGPGGLQHFSTYSKSVFTTLGERIAKILALVMIVLGIGALLYGHKLQTDRRYNYELHQAEHRSR